MKTLVLGLGNLLMRDEGVGIHVIQRLQKDVDLSKQVNILDGGVMGLELLRYFEGVDRLIIIDAIEMGVPPGTILRLENEEIPARITQKLSPHQSNLPELLALARLQDILPEHIIVWGMQPRCTDIGLNLSSEVADQLDALVQRAHQEILSTEYLNSQSGGT